MVDEDRVTELGERTLKTLEAMYPEAWKDAGGESDFDLVALSLDNLEQAVSAGQYTQAEQARLEAYAFFEFGPELRLNSLAPGIVGEVEGLVWFGAQDREGLARLIAQRAPAGQVRETRAALDEALEEARVTLGDGASDATIVTNAAIIVFREGLEAVLILAAITAGLVGSRGRHRRPVLIGAAMGLAISPFDVELPFWMGTWLGLFPTWQTLGAQVLAAAFVIGSYFAAEYVRIKRPRRLAAARRVDAQASS
ncbi:MAG: FTR1 family protein [Solirubrobacterales bacterium]|nr:FTR1 family protein [Solirubrobacterales bacterium]